MRAPFSMLLAQIDEGRFITACRHGLVHLIWERATLRFSRDEFRQLAGLLERAAGVRAVFTLQEGEIRVTHDPNQGEVRVGSSSLILSPGEFHDLVWAVGEAVRRLDEILASGIWDQEPEPPQDSYLEQLRRASFSDN